jgi:hypothetical protein
MRSMLICGFLLLLGSAGLAAHAQAPDAAATPPPETTAPPPLPFTAPTQVVAKDTPSDGGHSITIKWAAVPGVDHYRIEHAGADGVFAETATAGRLETTAEDSGIENRTPYRYRVVAVGPAGEEGVSSETAPAFSEPQWFNSDLVGVAIAIVAFVALISWYIRRARRGEHLFVRRIAGLEAVDEAVGRATEMGRSVLYIPGTGYISDIGTIASLNLLGEIAKKTAEYGTPINVPNRDPVVFTVAREVVKGGYAAAGRPDAFNPESVYFVVENTLAYAAAVSGIMVREKPATNFLMGPFYAESLILAETGAVTGAIQIAGTDSTSQLPFFIVACDYTLIGEELYAASAYLSREPLMLGALKGQDMGKLFFMVLLTIGTLLALATGLDVRWILSTSGY